MINNRKIVIDTFCEVYELIKQYADEEFSNLYDYTFHSNAIYIVSRPNFNIHKTQLTDAIRDKKIQIVISNVWEGSDTLLNFCKECDIIDLVLTNKIWLLSGGDIEHKYPHLTYDYFLTEVLNYEDNIKEIEIATDIYTKIPKPYKFLFLNGRTRANRKYLLTLFENTGLLNESLWTNLDTTLSDCNPLRSPLVSQYRTSLALKKLPKEYEVDRYVAGYDNVPAASDKFYFKYHMFNHEWGDIYIKAAPYIDTYFSLVTETIFEYPYSFRTEKLWKPVAVGHPFIVSTSQGYYRDLHKLGFKTFGHLIDESFDDLPNHQDRMDGLVATVQDLCAQDLPAFLSAAKETCKYNQQHLADMSVKVRKEFPQQFINFINERSRI